MLVFFKAHRNVPVFVQYDSGEKNCLVLRKGEYYNRVNINAEVTQNDDKRSKRDLCKAGML